MRELDRAAQEIVKVLLQPRNVDLMIVVRDMGDSPTENFMWGLRHEEVLTFDEFAAIGRAMLPLRRELNLDEVYNMSAEYDLYLDRVALRNTRVPLDQAQTARLDAIIDSIDGSDGWSGAIAALVLRKAQYILGRIASN